MKINYPGYLSVCCLVAGISFLLGGVVLAYSPTTTLPTAGYLVTGAVLLLTYAVARCTLVLSLILRENLGSVVESIQAASKPTQGMPRG